jgi:hypothetical protein
VILELTMENLENVALQIASLFHLQLFAELLQEFVMLQNIVLEMMQNVLQMSSQPVFAETVCVSETIL